MSAISILDVSAAPPAGTVQPGAQQGAQQGAADVFGPLLATALASAPGGPEGPAVSQLMGLLAAFNDPAQAAPQCIETLQAVLARHQAAGVDAQGVVNALGLALQRFQASEGAPENEPGEAGGLDMEALLTIASMIVGPEVVEAAIEQMQIGAPAEAASFEAQPPALQQAEAMLAAAPEPQSAPDAGQAVAAEGTAPAEPQAPSADVRPAADTPDTPAVPNAGVQESRNATVEPVITAQAAQAPVEETGQADAVPVDTPQAGNDATPTVNEALQEQSAPQQQSPALAVSAGTAEFAAPDVGPLAEQPTSEQDVLVQTGEKLLQAVEAAFSQPVGGAPGAPATAQTASQVDQQRMIDRIAGAISNAADSGRSTVRLRLYPPELGTVRIEVSSVRGVVTARIEASTPEAQQALNANLGTLRENMRSAGVDMRDVEVNYRNPSAHLGLGQQRRDSGGYEPQARRSWSESRQSQEAEDDLRLALQTVSAGLLDVLV